MSRLVLAHSRNVRAAVLLALLSAMTCSVLAEKWPSIQMPREVHSFEVGEGVTLNGTPMRLRGFVSSLPPRQVAEEFKRILGKSAIESTLPGKLIIGRREGEHYLVVEIEAAGTGSRGVTAVSQLEVAQDQRASARATSDLWMARMPAGSRLLSRMDSEDRSRLSRYLVISNGVDASVNRDRLVSALAADGFSLERESILGGENPRPDRASPVNGRMLFFRGVGKEGIATVHRDDRGQTTMVVNVVTAIERTR